MLEKGARANLKVDGSEEDGEMSEEDIVGMDDDLVIIDPENLLDGDDSEDSEPDEIDEMDNEEDGAAAAYVPERDDAKVVFSKHEGSVFCCDIDKTGQFAVTGGEDDLAYVWDLKTGEVVLTCKDHSDSVVSSKFNHDGTLVATGDMAGNIQVWKLTSKERVLNEATGELNWMEWHPAINVLFVGCADGNVMFWKVNSGESKILATMGSSTEVGKIMPDGKRAVIGYEDGSIRIFDLRTCKSLFTIPSDNIPIKSMHCHKDNTLVLAGCMNGDAKLINTKNGKLLGSLLCTDPESVCVESVEFCPVEGQSDLAACVCTNGDLSVWQVSQQEVRDGATLMSEITKLAWSKTDRRLILGTVLGNVDVYDGLDLSTANKELLGHSGAILDFSQSQDGKLLLTASDDNTARVFEMPVLE